MTDLVSIDLVRAASRSDDLPTDWTEADITRAADRYAKFLALAASDPLRPIAPTRDIDVMWHLHMLSPRAYHADCMRLFGHILDHDGGFGKDPAELPALLSVFEDTSNRWKSLFGEDYVAVSSSDASSDAVTKCWHDCQSRCWHACSTKSDVQIQLGA